SAAAGAGAYHLPRRQALRDHRLRAARDLGRLPDHLHAAAELHEVKQEFVERVNREMAVDFPASDLPAREALAGACRILAREGHESGLAGQVTARAEKRDAWWTLEFGYGFDEATPERMVLVDDDLKPLSGGRPNPGVRFHVWIYRKRTDVNAIVHTHAP